MSKFALLLTLFAAAITPTHAIAQSFSVERFAQDGDGSVNTWILESENEVVVIDTQRSLSAGAAAAEQVKAIGKPVAAILLTHPHPDHFGGLASFIAVFPEVPVYASFKTAEIMRTDGNGFIAMTKQVLGGDAPDQQPLPTRLFNDGDTLTFGAIKLKVDNIGQGEADAMTVFYSLQENVLFAGDIVDNKMTPFLLEGYTAQWLEQLEQVKGAYDAVNPLVYPGHGQQATMALFDKQIGMLRWLRARIGSLAQNGFSDEEATQIAAEYDRRYPNHPPVAAIPGLAILNVQAVAEELASAQ